VLVWDGVGLGAGGEGGGLGLALLVVGFGFGFGWAVGWALLLDLVAFGDAFALAFLCALLLALGLGDGLPLGLALPALGEVGVDCDAVAAAVVEWLNRFMNPTTPTALRSVARQVSVDSLRKPWSRCALRRSRCFMGP
jgi:hypothetical protein